MTAYTWTGTAGDGNYNTASNWSPNGVPGAADIATINTSAAQTITIAQNDAVQALTVGKLDTLAVSTGETLTAGNAATANTTLALAGTLSLNSTGNQSTLIIGSPTVTLNGGGTILLGDGNESNLILAGTAGDKLANVNGIIAGAGQIGDGGALAFSNAIIGVVDANVANQLVINTGSLTAINAGLFEATAGGGGLVLQTAVNQGTTGRIEASGAEVYLDGATIQGGTLGSTLGFSVQVASPSTLDGTANKVTNAGSLVVDTGETLSVLGTLNNTGVLSLQSAADDSDVVFGATGTLYTAVMLTGGGSVVLGDADGADRLYGGNGGDTLINLDNTISGSGNIGLGQLNLINDGTISATGTANALIIQTTSLLNNGLMQAVGSQGLILAAVINNSSTGTIASAGGTVQLAGATIAGGTLTSSLGGSFAVTGQGTLQTLSNLGTVEVNTGETLTLLGTITNTGTIGLNSTASNSDLIVAGPTVTLTGGGKVILSDTNSGDRIYGSAGTNVLDNVDNFIEGSGQIGAGRMTLVNAGTISATGTQGLVINLGSEGTNTATGQLLGVGTGGLSIQNGTYMNAGLIQADNGSNITFSGSAMLTNDSAAGVLSGGTYAAVSTGGSATLAVSGAAVQTLAADLILSGAGSSISFGGTAVEASLAVINVSSELQVLNGRSYTSTLAITNSGTVLLGGGTFTGKSLNGGAGSLLSGFGTLAGGFASAGTLTAAGGTLDLTGRDTISGAVNGSGTLALSGSAFTLADTNPVTVSAVALINRASLTISDSLSYAGIFRVAGADAIKGTGSLASSGRFEQTARGVATIADAFTNTGTISTVAGGTLAFSGGLANSGLILDAGGFTDTAALTGGSLKLVAKASAATLASTGGAGNSTLATLTTAGGALNTSGTTLTVTGDYVNTAAGTGNSYKPMAGITGTIDGQGTQLSVVGVNGTTIQNVGGTLSISVTAGQNAYFQIENTGASGSAALRGALQTTVNGGSINGTNLSGSGVTAGNFRPIAAGGAGGVFTIAYKGGAISNEAIHLSSDFANVAGLTINIVSKAPGAAQPAEVFGSYEAHSTQQEILAVPHHG